MTVNEAKKLYKQYNGSLFSLAREDNVKYSSYQKLAITKEMEQQWRLELIQEVYQLIKCKGDVSSFNQLYNLTEGLHTKENLSVLMNALQCTLVEDSKSSLILAETIMGRKGIPQRSGMIFWAKDLGANEDVVRLLQAVTKYLSITPTDARMQDRLERDRILLEEIRTKVV